MRFIEQNTHRNGSCTSGGSNRLGAAAGTPAPATRSLRFLWPKGNACPSALPALALGSAPCHHHVAAPRSIIHCPAPHGTNRPCPSHRCAKNLPPTLPRRGHCCPAPNCCLRHSNALRVRCHQGPMEPSTGPAPSTTSTCGEAMRTTYWKVGWWAQAAIRLRSGTPNGR